MAVAPHKLEVKGLKANGRCAEILLDGKPLLVSEVMIIAGVGKPTQVYPKILVDETNLDTAVDGAHLTVEQRALPGRLPKPRDAETWK